MKRSKRLLVLLGVFLICCGATFALTRYEQKQEEIRTSEDVVLSIDPDSVQSVSWEFEEGGFAFHREDGVWCYDDDAAFPVSAEKLEDILSHFSAFGVSFAIENVEDYGQYGLDDPTCVIQIATGDESVSVRLGSYSQMDEQRYVDIGDGCVYLVRSDPMDYLASALTDLIEHDETPGFETVTSITFSGSEDYTITREEDNGASYDPDDVYLTRRDGTLSPLDPDAVEDYLSEITGLSLLDYATYNATDEELAAFGLAEPALSVSVNYTQTEEDETEVAHVFELHIGQNAEELAAYEAALDAGEEPPEVTRYVRVGASQIVYLLSESDYLALTSAGYDDLRHQTLFWADFESVTQIDVTLEDETHTLTAAPDDEDEDARVWACDGAEFEEASLKSALYALRASRFTTDAPDDREEIRLTLYLEDENFPQVTIALYRCDGSTCLAVVDGESVCYVSRSSVVELIEAVQTIVLE